MSLSKGFETYNSGYRCATYHLKSLIIDFTEKSTPYFGKTQYYGRTRGIPCSKIWITIEEQENAACFVGTLTHELAHALLRPTKRQQKGHDSEWFRLASKLVVIINDNLDYLGINEEIIDVAGGLPVA